MTKIIRILFFIYHLIFHSPIAACRFRPTCSEYTLEAFGKYGVAKGVVLSARRIASCHPFSKRPIYDPV